MGIIIMVAIMKEGVVIIMTEVAGLSKIITGLNTIMNIDRWMRGNTISTLKVSGVYVTDIVRGSSNGEESRLHEEHGRKKDIRV